MNIKKISPLLFFILFLLPDNAISQKKDSIQAIKNVQIERDFTPEVMPVERPVIDLQVEQPKISKLTPSFSSFFAPYTLKPTPLIPLQAQELGSINRKDSKSGFLRIGAGVLFNWLADFWYPVWNTDEGYFDIFIHHRGISGITKKSPQNLLNTAIGINFYKNFDENQLYLTTIYGNETFNYFGLDEKLQTFHTTNNWDSIFSKKQSFNKADITLGMRTRERNLNDWLWDASLNYHLHSTSNRLLEHNINADVMIDKLFDDNSLVAHGGAKIYFYKNRDSIDMRQTPSIRGIDDVKWQPNVILYLKPAFLWNFDDVKIRLGAKSFFSFSKKPVVALSPDIKIDYFLKNFLNLFVGATGDYQINSMANITEANRYFNLSGTEHNTYTPFDVFGGFKVKILKGLMLDASVNYKYVFNTIFFKNSAFLYNNTDSCFNRYFTAVSNSGSALETNVRLSYNIKERVNIFTSMKYNKWFLKQSKDSLSSFYAWHTPEWRIDAGVDVKIGKGFFGNINFYFLSDMKAEKVAADATTSQKQSVITLPATFDLNIGGGYNINRNFSIYAQINNILAISPKLNPDIWYGYKTIGFNALIGLTVQF